MCIFTYELFFLYSSAFVFEFCKFICWSVTVNLLATALFHVYVPLLDSMHDF
jgi:hypothetical protein